MWGSSIYDIAIKCMSKYVDNTSGDRNSYNVVDDKIGDEIYYMGFSEGLVNRSTLMFEKDSYIPVLETYDNNKLLNYL